MYQTTGFVLKMHSFFKREKHTQKINYRLTKFLYFFFDRRMYFEQLRNKDNYCDSTWDRNGEELRKSFLEKTSLAVNLEKAAP